MKNREESLSLRQYKTKRKEELLECVYAVLTAFLMMLPVAAFMYGAVVTYDDGEPASVFVMFLFLGIGLFVAGVILRLIYQQFLKSKKEVVTAREEYFTAADEAEVLSFNSRKRKQRICIVSVFSSAFVVIIALNIASIIKIDRIYTSAEELISQEKYEEALSILETIEKKRHKDTLSLIVLCESHIDYNRGYGADAYYDMKKANFYWQNDEQKARIDDFIDILQNEHDEYIKRMSENAKKSYESKKNNESVQKKNSSKSTYVPKYKKDTSDPYNAKDYRNEEDFYDDHYDDFFDYYDAESYYRSHQD